MGNDQHRQLPYTTYDFNWQGRDDREDGDQGTRIHHIIQQMQPSQLANNELGSELDSNLKPRAINLLGFACDAGVARNKGRIGAKQAPDLIRSALANMAWHQPCSLIDLGNITCQGDLLEHSQDECAQIISSALHSNSVITFGGGHEVAWASFQGLARYLKHTQPEVIPKIGIINFDAHFDLRTFESDTADVQPSSGTPFNQIHEFCHHNNWPFHYACLGVCRASNTQALFERAKNLGVWFVEDSQLSHINTPSHLVQLQNFIDDCDYLYLTIDLDVFPAATAPGVSAPAGRGVSIDILAPFLEKILSEKDKIIIADIAEYNPTYDVDNQTARLAARLCWDIANALSEHE